MEIVRYGAEAEKRLNAQSEAKQIEILKKRYAYFNIHESDRPKVGEYLKVDGQYLRLAHDWDEVIQTTVKSGHPCFGDVSFYLGNGYMDFSGSLDEALTVDKMVLTDETREGSCWFFFDESASAHSGVYCRVNLRVWEYKE